MPIPDEESWKVYTANIDTNYLHQYYGGKTVSQVKYRFENFPLGAVEELYSMPAIPFQYYIFACVELLEDKTLYGPELEELAASFLNLVLWKLNNSPLDILPILSDLMPIVELVGLNQEKFEDNPENNGLYLLRVNKIKTMLTNFQG